jgi:hypothetical protein
MPAAHRKKRYEGTTKIKILFIAGFGPIVRDPDSSRSLYEGTLRIPFEEGPGGYLHTGQLDGAKHFALWPLTQAAESCFGTGSWPEDLAVPQAWLELEVEDISSATDELVRRGHHLLVRAQKEPWGQTVTRWLDPSGLLIAVTDTPWLRPKRK